MRGHCSNFSSANALKVADVVSIYYTKYQGKIQNAYVHTAKYFNTTYCSTVSEYWTTRDVIVPPTWKSCMKVTHW